MMWPALRARRRIAWRQQLCVDGADTIRASLQPGRRGRVPAVPLALLRRDAEGCQLVVVICRRQGVNRHDWRVPGAAAAGARVHGKLCVEVVIQCCSGTQVSRLWRLLHQLSEASFIIRPGQADWSRRLWLHVRAAGIERDGGRVARAWRHVRRRRGRRVVFRKNGSSEEWVVRNAAAGQDAWRVAGRQVSEVCTQRAEQLGRRSGRRRREGGRDIKSCCFIVCGCCRSGGLRHSSRVRAVRSVQHERLRLRLVLGRCWRPRVDAQRRAAARV